MNVQNNIQPRVKWVLLAVATMTALGCVSQRYVDDLETLYRRSQEQTLDLQARLEEKNTEIEVLRSSLNSQDPEILAKLEKALSSHTKLTSALAKAEGRLREISSEPILDPAMDAALVQLVQSNPKLMTYEPEIGMVKFHSDLTFALGSADVNAQASTSLQSLAQILKSKVGQNYITRIVGHTDNVPIGRPATRAKHPTNWHLSVNRAIAVKDLLVKAGVDPSRMGVAGYGEHRPIAPNGPKGNELNRRVEIYLVRYAPSHNLASPAGSGSGLDLKSREKEADSNPRTGIQTADAPGGMFK